MVKLTFFNKYNLLIFIDSNNNGVFDTGGVDQEHTPGVNDIPLDANGIDSQIVFVVGDIPASLNDGDEGVIELVANAATPGAAGSAPGTVLNGLGDGGVDVLIGLTEASADITGIYEVASLIDVNITKNPKNKMIEVKQIAFPVSWKVILMAFSMVCPLFRLNLNLLKK